MEQEKYEKNGEEIIHLAEGMTYTQWRRIAHLIERNFDIVRGTVILKLPSPERLEMQMKHDFIKD